MSVGNVFADLTQIPIYYRTSHDLFPQLQLPGGEICFELINLEANIALDKNEIRNIKYVI